MTGSQSASSTTFQAPSGVAVRVVATPEEGQRLAMALLVSLGLEHRSPGVGLATGRTYEGFFAEIGRACKAGELDLSAYRLTHLDEFLDTATDEPGGMAHEILQAINPEGSPEGPAFTPVVADGSGEPELLHEKRLAEFGPIHLQFLGIGRNGHVAFNEPGTPFHRRTHVIELDTPTREDNGARFTDGVCPTHALTQGPANILDADRIVLMAFGESKAAIVAEMLAGPLSPACPAGLVRLHPNALIILDGPAASQLSSTATIDARRLPTLVTSAGVLEPAGPVAVISPHPDDASLSCGGLLAGLPGHVPRTILQMTTGARAQVPGRSREEVAALREQECQEEARILDADLQLLRCSFYESGGFEADDVENLLARLRDLRPALILAPDRADPHPTHRLSRLVADEAIRRLVLETGSALEIWSFEGAWHQHAPSAVNTLVTFTAEQEAVKLAAAEAHRSQISRVPFQEGARAMARVRATTFSESHLGCTSGTRETLPLVEAYVRESLGPAT